MLFIIGAQLESSVLLCDGEAVSLRTLLIEDIDWTKIIASGIQVLDVNYGIAAMFR